MNRPQPLVPSDLPWPSSFFSDELAPSLINESPLLSAPTQSLRPDPTVTRYIARLRTLSSKFAATVDELERHLQGDLPPAAIGTDAASEESEEDEDANARTKRLRGTSFYCGACKKTLSGNPRKHWATDRHVRCIRGWRGSSHKKFCSRDQHELLHDPLSEWVKKRLPDGVDDQTLVVCRFCGGLVAPMASAASNTVSADTRPAKRARARAPEPEYTNSP